MAALVARRWNGLQRLRRRLGDDKIGFESSGGYEVFSEADAQRYAACAEALPRLNRLLAPHIGIKEVFVHADERITSLGLQQIQHLIASPAEALIDTGKMMKNLLALADSIGVRRLHGLEISDIRTDEKGVALQCTGGWQLTSRRAIVAVNGFARKLLPQVQVTPARNLVLVTRPLPAFNLKGAFHYHEGYVYFRNIGQRLLIGGARHLDLQGEETDTEGRNEQIYSYLCSFMEKHIQPGSASQIEYEWSGILGLGQQKTPIVQELSPNLWVAVRLGGMGVAIGTEIGDQVAEAVARSLEIAAD